MRATERERGEKEREREREREREEETDREKPTIRQIDKATDKQAECEQQNWTLYRHT